MYDPVLFGAIHPAKRFEVPVVHGRVACRRLHNVSIERCLECPYLVRIERNGWLRVVCQLPAGEAASAATGWHDQAP